MTRNRSLTLAPWIFTVGFFLLWEFVCRTFSVSIFILPAPSTILAAIWEYRSQLAFHGAHTLWMTLAGFLLATVFGLLLGMALGASRLVNAGVLPAPRRLQLDPEGRGGADPGVLVRRRLATAGADGIPDLVLSDRGERGHRHLHHRAETEDVLRALGASKRDIIVKVGVPRAMPYFFGSLKVAITLAYVGLGHRRAERVECGHRQPPHPRLRRLRGAPRLGRPRGPRDHGRGHVHGDGDGRALHDGLGAAEQMAA
jgi:NitT/TauT family transport system permease protein